MPIVPVGDMRLMLKYNSKNYLQQDLTDYVFDCQTLGFVANGNPVDSIKVGQKARVLIGGARKQTVEHLQAAASHAGIVLDQIMPGLVCAANAFEFAMPEIFTNEVIALVDIG